MRKHIKQNLLDIIKTMYEAHEVVKGNIESGNSDDAVALLSDCQNTAVDLGGLIEKTEGENTRTVALLEEYCDELYNSAVSISENENVNSYKLCKNIDKKLRAVENSVRSDIKVCLEIVFMPYKASMWDSLESVWKAADEDPECDAYVVPIPYYDRTPHGTFGEYHYEGDEFPEYVPITRYDEYDLENRRPDVIYIHNPYDNNNFVTSVDPRFYSFMLKKYTDKLVYIPYYSTSGGMSEGQISCSAYYYADYIVTQAKKYRDFFDLSLPNDKFLPFGSPKFDRVINMCKNPPEPPAVWKEKMSGKKVYFYNTSIGGMLANTECFMRKVRYVFKTFAEHKDACLLWRPHPLLESTIDSMRPQFKQEFEDIKRFFIENNIGIYDDTPDITSTIAQCDAYIGDSGTSVTSLFGIAGKPLFILNNCIDTLPEKDDWRGEILSKGFSVFGDNKWFSTMGDMLYYSEDDDYNYRYVCDLSEYSAGYEYCYAISAGGKTYICPANAQDILEVNENGIQKRIELEKRTERTAFYGAISDGKYIFLIPNYYSAIVRYNTENGEIKYIEDNLDIMVGNRGTGRVIGGVFIHKGFLFIGSPMDSRILAVNVETCQGQILTTGSKKNGGCMIIQSDGEQLWLMPFEGVYVTAWDPETGDMREYEDFPKELVCKNPNYGFDCMDRPFSHPAFCGDYVYIPAYWANMNIKLNKKTGEITKLELPFDIDKEMKNGYYISWCRGCFIRSDDKYQIYDAYARRLYDADLENEIYNEININFDLNELKENEPGFGRHSQHLQYCCVENAFNSLSDFLDGSITGNTFDKEKQIEAYGEIAANHDGTCGEKVHKFIKKKVIQN